MENKVLHWFFAAENPYQEQFLYIYFGSCYMFFGNVKGS